MQYKNYRGEKMEILEKAVSGTTESSDIYITVEPNDEKAITVDLQSDVAKQYGDRIEEVIMNTVKNLGVESVKITAVDSGALDCTISARTLNALQRSLGNEAYNWKEIETWNV